MTLGNYPKVITKHYGPMWNQSKTRDALPDRINQTDKNAITSDAQGDVQIVSGESNIQIINTGVNASIVVQSGATVNSEHQKKVDQARNLLEKHRYNEALEYLISLKKEIWTRANNYTKFRVLTNIASAQSKLQMHSEAAVNYLEGGYILVNTTQGNIFRSN